MTTPAANGCREFNRASRVSRREVLRLGGMGAFGLGLPGLLRAEQVSPAKPPRAKSVLLLYCFGGPSHLDMWDMKPDGPSAIRGEFQPIATRLPGTVYCEHLPLLAARNDRFTLVRAVTHDRNVHGGAVGYTLTGTATADPGIPGVRGPDAGLGDHPALGAVVNKLTPADGAVPSAITLPWDMIDGQGRYVPGQNAGLLGGKFDPWFVNSNPNDPKFQVEGLQLSKGINAARLDARRSLLAAVNQQATHVERIAQMTALDAYYEKAFSLLTSPATKQAFDLASEPAALRDRYGRNALGQACLLGRRMIEAGVRLVQVNTGNRLSNEFGWDTHGDNFNMLKKKLLPRFDPAFSTLLDDMEERGLLDETLVVCMGEFGRTPKISKNAGREHWPQCYSMIFAGAGVRRGYQHGRSDKQGAYPAADPVTPDDLIATVYDALGIEPSQLILDQQGREHILVKGQPIRAVFGDS